MAEFGVEPKLEGSDFNGLLHGDGANDDTEIGKKLISDMRKIAA